MDKILTIIIPTYNMEKYLRHCLDSLIVPNMDKVEVLVVNDGSKDSSSAIGHEYQDKYPQTFRVIDKENGNYGSCINRGLKETTGKYVKVLDADDYFDSNNYNQFILELEQLDYDVVLTDFIHVNESYSCTAKIKLNVPANEALTLQDITKVYPIGLDMHSATYKLSLIKDINYVQPEGISYTDQIWMQEPFAYISSAIYLPLTVYCYLLGREGQTMDPKIVYKNMKAHIICALSMLDRTIKYHGIEEGKTFMLNKTLNTIIAIYNVYLFLNPSLTLQELIDFDSEIKKKDRNTYEILNHVVFNRVVPLKYIKKWREKPQKRLNKKTRHLFNLCETINRMLMHFVRKYKMRYPKFSSRLENLTKKII